MSQDSEPWALCADWLSRCGTLSDVQSLESVEHLASVLKDGVILCKTLNRLKTNCIPYKSFSLRPQGSSFLSTMNIRTFLLYCKSDFMLSEGQLFKIDDLLNVEKFGKVIFTLSKLSMTRFAKNWNIEGFNAEEDTDYVIMERALEEAEEEYDSSLYVAGEEAFDDNSEDIYDILITSQCPSEMPVPKSKKESCMLELLTTEKNFLAVIDTINNLFMKKLKNVLRAEEFATIFFMLDEVKKVHRELYTDIETAFKSSQPALGIAKCFVDHHTSLVFYGELSSKMGAAMEELEKVCRENREVADVVKRSNDLAKVKLHDLLAVPIVRVLKYHLIIKELLKHSQGDEVVELKKALSAIEDLNLYINEVKRDYESMNTITKIQRSIKNIQNYFNSSITSLDSYGRRHFDGEFDIKKVKQGKSSTISSGYIFLFDKVLIICSAKKRGEQYEYRASLAIITIKVQPASNDKGMSQLVLTTSGAEDEKFILSTKKSDNLLKLYNYIELAKSNCCPEGYKANGHHFLLTNFSEVARCLVCNKLLRGKISQGYRCKNTKKIAHKECLTKVGKDAPERKQEKEELPPKRTTRRVPLPPKDTDAQEPTRPAISVPTVVPPVNPPRPPKPNLDPVVQKRKKQLRNSLESQPWYSTLNRNSSVGLLKDLPDGTFLVRYNNDKGNHSISLKYQTVRHLMINRAENGDYYLKAGQTFDSIPSLVDYYRNNSLQPVYSAIASSLGQPYSEVEKRGPRTCRAMYDFSPHDKGQLEFKKDDIIEILLTKDDVWWRGRLGNKRGNFPSNYVEVLED